MFLVILGYYEVLNTITDKGIYQASGNLVEGIEVQL